MVDYLLGAAQGIASAMALSWAQNAGATSSVAEIFLRALLIGTPAGVVSLILYCSIYVRLASRAGHTVGRNQVFHVVAYGGVPLAASLVIWGFSALLIGEVAFELTPHPEVETFVALLLRIQFIAYLLLWLWSVVIQVMGLSEIQGIATRKAFGLWVMGQLIAILAMLFLRLLIATLFPGAP
jgi:hypothetical protein